MENNPEIIVLQLNGTNKVKVKNFKLKNNFTFFNCHFSL